MKKLIGIYTSPRAHWVGDGFPVRTLFSYDSMGKHISPFLLLDHAGPADFAPTDQRRGVGQHPHRGFETVTIVYDGEVEHRDSTGAGGKIGPGDVQWMTAAKGILHEEFHSAAFARSGGALEMVQLWVNLPAKDKMADAGYQTIVDGDIPVLLDLDIVENAFGKASGAQGLQPHRLALEPRARRVETVDPGVSMLEAKVLGRQLG